MCRLDQLISARREEKRREEKRREEKKKTKKKMRQEIDSTLPILYIGERKRQQMLTLWSNSIKF